MNILSIIPSMPDTLEKAKLAQQGELGETGKFYVRIINTLPDRLLTQLMKRSDTCEPIRERLDFPAVLLQSSDIVGD